MNSNIYDPHIDAVSRNFKAVAVWLTPQDNSLFVLFYSSTEMPCLAMYNDNMLHRAKIVSVKSYDPAALVVQFVDYGSTTVLETCR